MHLGMTECHIPFSGYCDLDLWPSFNNNCVRSIQVSLIYHVFKIGISNLVCEGILEWWSVLYHLQVTVTLTSDLVSEKLCREHSSYIIKGRNPKFGVLMQLWMAECHIPFLVTMTLTSDLVCRIIVSRTYLLYYLRWESQICCMDTSLDADVWYSILGHCELDQYDLVSRIIMSGAYLLYYLM